MLALRGSGGIKAGRILPPPGVHRTPPDTKNVKKNNEFLSFFKKNGAGVRVLWSVASFFDESFG